MSRPRCPFHPALPADTPCERCGRLFCSHCVRDWNGRALGPLCRKARIRRRIGIAAILAVMLSLPAAVIIWGVDQRLKHGPDHARIRQRKRLLDKFPNAPETRLRLARSLLRSGRRDQAIRELDRLLKRRPTHLGALLLRTRIAREDRDYEATLRWSNRALITAPASRIARRAQAQAFVALGQPDKAEASLREGLRRSPRATELALQLANLLAAQHRGPEAVKILHETLRRGPPLAERQQLSDRITALQQ